MRSDKANCHCLVIYREVFQLQKRLCKSSPKAQRFFYICTGGYAHIMLFALSTSKNNLSHKLQWFSVANGRFSLPTQDIGKTEAHMRTNYLHSSLTQKCHRLISSFYIKQTGKVRSKTSQFWKFIDDARILLFGCYFSHF